MKNNFEKLTKLNIIRYFFYIPYRMYYENDIFIKAMNSLISMKSYMIISVFSNLEDFLIQIFQIPTRILK